MAYEKIGNFSCFYRIGVTWPLVFVYKARVAVKLSGFVVCGERGECIRELGREEERVGRREGHELGLGQVPRHRDSLILVLLTATTTTTTPTTTTYIARRGDRDPGGKAGAVAGPVAWGSVSLSHVFIS